MGDKAYYAEQNEDGGYSFLRGPDGFGCCLGEPEDCTWYRDGKPAVERLNQQHEALTACSLRYASLLAVLRQCVEQGDNVVQTWQTVPLHNHHMGIAITGLSVTLAAARPFLGGDKT